MMQPAMWGVSTEGYIILDSGNPQGLQQPASREASANAYDLLDTGNSQAMMLPQVGSLVA